MVPWQEYKPGIIACRALGGQPRVIVPAHADALDKLFTYRLAPPDRPADSRQSKRRANLAPPISQWPAAQHIARDQLVALSVLSAALSAASPVLSALSLPPSTISEVAFFIRVQALEADSRVCCHVSLAWLWALDHQESL